MAVITYKCANCGGPLTWDADKQKYFCDYCNSSFTEEELAKMRPESAQTEASPEGETAAETAAADPAAQEATAGNKDASAAKQKIAVHYSCPNCGAEIMTDETTAASTCYYCHNPVVLTDRLSGEMLPDCVIPFEISRDKAREIFLGWVRQHRYIPSSFYDEKAIASMSGVYFPYWIYNAKVRGAIRGEGRKLRVWIAGDMQYTETQLFNVEREGAMDVSNVTRIALKKASKVLCESVMPFDPSKMQAFQPAYLQGYAAEMRDIESAALQDEVDQEIVQFAKNKLLSEADSGYDNFRTISITADKDTGSWKYALLPVWTLTYQDKAGGKLYYFSINGQSGKTCGELPVDRGKLLRLFIIVFLVTLALMWALMWFAFS